MSWIRPPADTERLRVPRSHAMLTRTREENSLRRAMETAATSAMSCGSSGGAMNRESWKFFEWKFLKKKHSFPIGSMYAIYGNIYHQYTPNVSIYTIHGSYGCKKKTCVCHHLLQISKFNIFQHISTSHSLPEVPLLIAQLAHGLEEAAQLLLSTSQYRLSRPAEGHQQRHIAPG